MVQLYKWKNRTQKSVFTLKKYVLGADVSRLNFVAGTVGNLHSKVDSLVFDNDLVDVAEAHLPKGKRVILVGSLSTSVAFQKEGHASQLIDSLKEISKQLNCAVALTCGYKSLPLKDVRTLKRFYAKRGFKDILPRSGRYLIYE